VNSEDRLVSLREASVRLSVSPITLRRWIRQGLLPSVRLGGTRRLRAGDIEALIRVGLPLERGKGSRAVAGH